MEQKSISLDGSRLTIHEINALVRDPGTAVTLADSAIEKVRKSHDFLNHKLQDKVVYGVNTGFGPMASYVIGREQLLELQVNLVRSHAVGMGEPIEDEYVLASMVVRLNTLLKGYSGVSEELVKHLQLFINKRIIPIIPEHGAVGTSGDLTQLAHIALALIGEGTARYNGAHRPVAEILKELSIKPYTLKAKEGLSLINGTSVMSGIAAVVCMRAHHLLSTAVQHGAFALELVHGFSDSFSETLNSLRPHQGQIEIARALRELLASSKLLRDRKIFQKNHHATQETHAIPEGVQEIYSLRCIPQILGPVYDSLMHTWGVVELEINSVTDNPIVDWEREAFLHGGNFHGDYIASSIDQLKMTLVKLTMLSERRINFFLHSAVNKHFPPFLNLKEPGLTLGLQGLQFVATSTTAQSQTLAFPQYVHSIPTNADNQDVVSMGADAALLTARVVQNAYVLLVIEIITLTQAAEINGIKDKLSASSRSLYDALRALFPAITNDRNISAELPHILSFVKKRDVLRVLRRPGNSQ